MICQIAVWEKNYPKGEVAGLQNLIRQLQTATAQ